MHSMQAGYLEKAQKYTDKALMQLEKLKSKSGSVGLSGSSSPLVGGPITTSYAGPEGPLKTAARVPAPWILLPQLADGDDPGSGRAGQAWTGSLIPRGLCCGVVVPSLSCPPHCAR